MVINFFYNKQQPNADEGKVANYQNFWTEAQYLMNALYLVVHP